MAMTATRGELKDLDAATLREWLTDGRAYLVDVREPAEFAAGRIPGSVPMPLSSFDPAAVRVPDGQQLVFHCKSGMRAGEAGERMLKAGYNDLVWCFRPGLAGWQAAGYEVEADLDAKPPVMDVMRQTQITVGTLSLLGVILAATVSSAWLVLPGMIGCGLIFAGASGRCPLATGIAKMPWNRGASCPGGNCRV